LASSNGPNPRQESIRKAVKKLYDVTGESVPSMQINTATGDDFVQIGNGVMPEAMRKVMHNN